MALFDKKRPEPVSIAGHDVTCEVCGGTQFWHRTAQLNTAVATFFNVDWANPSADCYVCDGCGHIYWFLPRR